MKIIILQMIAILILGCMMAFGENLTIDGSSAYEKDTYIENIDQGELVYDEILYKKKLSGDNYKQDYIQYAYKLGGEKFVRMLEGENDTWDMYRRSGIIQDGVQEDARGFCQFNRIWWKSIVDTKRFWNDPYWQLDQCYKHWRKGTIFYGNITHEQFLQRFGIRYEIHYIDSMNTYSNDNIK